MKIIAIFNPSSGNQQKDFIKAELEQAFEKYDYELWVVNKSKSIRELAKKALLEHANVIIAVGGDGTVVDVISQIIHSKVTLGIIPAGTGNMLAYNLGIPEDTSEAINIIKNKHKQKIDTAKINEHHFAFLAGCGFDAFIIQQTSREKKKKLGKVAYFIEGFRHAFGYNKVKFKIKLDDKKVIKTKASTVMIANGANIINDIFSLAPDASLTDGFLDLVVISPKTMFDNIPVFIRLLLKKPKVKSNSLQQYKAKKIEITSKPKVPVQADGDIICTTPVNIEIVPRSLTVFVPKVICDSLFCSFKKGLKKILGL